ncbi:hypothetical protein GCM10012320_17080 [Sinomonas cellulolyticus]|uniref:Integral membrane protein n=1 Tax=Sinomonas cellulolyticus TaxID=2801916 RepID=A0ABS1K0X3_9MICC|nr:MULTISPECIES: DUF6350 family protein [Sinomonas]MBL0704532.1 hypothetical protein [Sinomonas cellulolyticus]GHG49216.1 hypothetical protein GCM10012320_17080 [Sinomonas sp. KCTC 49339]
MKLSADQSGLRGLPMPLWLQGVVESVQAILISAMLTLVAVFGVWATGGLGPWPPEAVARLAGQTWLLVHGVPLHLNLTSGTGEAAQSVSGTLSLIPLGLTLVPVLLSWRAGRRLARASYADTLWQGLAGAAGIYAAFGFATAFVCRTPEVGVGMVAATLIPLIPVGLGLVVGARREAGSWVRLFGVDAVDWLARTGQYSRWAGTYAWAVVRAGFLAAVAALGLSAALLGVDLFWRWAEAVTVYEGVSAGGVGGAAMTLGQLGYLPHLVVWTLGWASGAGVTLGTGSTAGALATAVGPLPPVPVLAAVPTGPLVWAPAALVVPVLAGLLGGWWFVREGEDHFDEWLSIKVRARWFSAPVSAVFLGLCVGAVAGALAAGLAWLTSGSLGIGRFTELGVSSLWMLVWVGAETAVGACLGYALGPWLERSRTAEEPRRSRVP